MKTPQLSETPPESVEERVALVRELSVWFKHVQAVTPALHRARRNAVVHLFDVEGISRREIAAQTGLSEQRVRDILKERHAVDAPSIPGQIDLDV